MTNAMKPAVLIWISVDAAVKMSRGAVPLTWYTNRQSVPDPSNYVQIIVPYDYFIQMYDAKDELERSTKDLIL